MRECVDRVQLRHSDACRIRVEWVDKCFHILALGILQNEIDTDVEFGLCLHEYRFKEFPVEDDVIRGHLHALDG